MKTKLLKLVKSLHPARISVLTSYLLRDEAISGKLIILALALAILAVNTPLAPFYEAFLQTKVTIGFGDWSLALDLKHWISEGLMVFFFLVVGLELKRELLHGQLQHKKTALLPSIAAIGGMIIPALIFILFNLGRETISGWAIPTATDIALAVGLLALLGDRIPSSLRLFILLLAIVDDILAVIIIAVFYSTDINLVALISVFGLSSLIYLLGKMRWLHMPVLVVAGLTLWVLAYESGIHPSIVGVLLGLILPMANSKEHEGRMAERVERAAIPFSTLVVVPLFAFASTGLSLDVSGINLETAFTLGGGILAGLVIGKVLGIFGVTWLMVKFGLTSLPSGIRWSHIAGIGFLAGIGFTVSVFVTELSFINSEYITVAKLSIVVASAVAACLGLLILRFAKNRP